MSVMGKVLMALAVFALIPGCAKREPMSRTRNGAMGNSITIKGSDTMVLLAQWWVENYMKANPRLIIQVNGGGSGTGIAALQNGSTDIAQSSRPIREEELAAFKAKYNREVTEIKVALDGLGVYVHQDSPLKELTLAQIRDIYTGKTNDWSEVGGNPGKILLYSRENNSGTYEFFKEHVLEKADFATRTQTLSGNAAVISAIGQDPAGIGYGGIAFAKGVKVLAIKRDEASPGILPAFENIADGSYPISRFLYWYLPYDPAANPSGEIKKLVNWVLSDAGQAAVKEVGYFPLRIKGNGGP